MIDFVPDGFFSVVMTVFGLLLGSFGNVVIWRFPRGESVVSPGSHCPACDAPVRWYDNLPVVSWFVLHGRCRECAEPISTRYPLVETASGVLWVTAALAFGPTPQSLVAAIFFWTLLVLSMIDLDTMRLPNPIIAALALFGLTSVLFSQFAGVHAAPLTTATDSPLLDAALGVLLGGGVSGGVAGLYALIRGRSGFGMGDVKLLGAMGLFLGPYVLLALMIGSMVGAVYGIASAARSGSGLSAKIPFGPFLALGGIATALAGPELVDWYLSLVGLV